MPTDPAAELSELELDALWTIYEGHSLVIETPQSDDLDPSANAILSVAYDEADEAIAEAAEIPMDTVERLIAMGFLERSDDGPVLDATSWYDDELGCEVHAEEYVLSRLGQQVVDATADGPGELGDFLDEDEDDDEDWDDDEDLDDEFGDELSDDDDEDEDL